MSTAATAAIPPTFILRLWQRYLSALRTRPLRTKMITSGILYVVGDSVAQFGIEGRRIGVGEVAEEDRWDPTRTARLTFYGGLIFAPLAHRWLGFIDRVRVKSKLGTLAARLSIDSLLWSPFVCILFPSSLGLLEGRGPEDIKQKVQMAWFPTWQRAIVVFGPTQLINFTLIPVQHRLLTLQSVGLCWNIYLSYQNNINNRLMAEAIKLSQEAETPMQEMMATKELERAKKRKEEIRIEEDGVAGVGTRMGWA